MANAAEISHGLFQFAQGYALGRGFKFGEGANSQLQYSLTVYSNAKSSLTDSKVAEAERGIVRFVDSMIEARQFVYAADKLQSNIIGEDTFAWAKNKLCPIIPIC